MAERALRGTRLGATSYENDRNTDLAPRQEIAFDCPKGHHFTVPFAAEAEVPATWECRVCGVTAFTATGDLSAPRKAKPPRSHWDMLRERRSIADLEEVLAERLALIRRGNPAQAHHQAPQERIVHPERPGLARAVQDVRPLSACCRRPRAAPPSGTPAPSARSARTPPS
jgi:hypothetical protein